MRLAKWLIFISVLLLPVMTVYSDTEAQPIGEGKEIIHDASKIWTVEFSHDVDPDSVELMMVDEFQNEIEIETESSGKIVRVTPAEPYNEDHEYILIIEEASSLHGEGLTEKAMKTFVYEREQYEVTFLNGEADVIRIEKVRDGESAEAPKSPDKEGYRFVGWDTDFSLVQEDLTVRPVFEEEEDNIQVFSFQGLEMGDSKERLLEEMGDPDRIDPSLTQYDWYVYKGDYTEYMQIGIHDGVIAAFFSPNATWAFSDRDISLGDSKEDVESELGDHFDLIRQNPLSNRSRAFRRYERSGIEYHMMFEVNQHPAELMGLKVELAETVSPLNGSSFESEYRESFIEAQELMLAELINVERVKNGLSILGKMPSLTQAANFHSRHMLEHDYFEHVSPDGLTLQDRLREFDVDFSLAGENLAYGIRTAIDAHQGLMNSYRHRENILYVAYDHVGIGFEQGDGGTYWTQKFIAE
ncbi:CAP-associated domain-containing protein [Salisediminibacterium selenitireducens]|uniref:SCP-like extracellular n=1 Tax=Bacillus selenitireducens (strain ATCC 700615 / DSM 15326 / MLS10) TaxID=439292 RepID=D6Y074_BACIE|nr:CAP-associated domain-containing protein [Salisediminibacterium selenitireducens]ADH98465.1 SCP-like extracellular [[Bacillus] selenitireducens MLS10]